MNQSIIPTRRGREEATISRIAPVSIVTSRWATAQRPVAIVIFTLVALFVFEATSYAREVIGSKSARVSANVSAGRVQVAESFTLDLVVSAPSGTQVVLPFVGKQLGDFDVIDCQDVSDIPSSENANERIWTRRMTLDSIKTGDLEIPALESQITSGSDFEIIRSEPITVHVISVLEGQADPAQLRDIQSVVDVNVPQPRSNRWIWWLTGVAGLMLLAAASTIVLAKRKTWMTPSHWALNELSALRQENAAEHVNSQAVVERLSSILRDYLELQFEVSAPVQTTQELLDIIESKKLLEPELVAGFSELFEAADFAKFAGVQMSSSELMSAIDATRQLIERSSQLAESEFDMTEDSINSQSQSLANPTTSAIGQGEK